MFFRCLPWVWSSHHLQFWKSACQYPPHIETCRHHKSWTLARLANCFCTLLPHSASEESSGENDFKARIYQHLKGLAEESLERSQQFVQVPIDALDVGAQEYSHHRVHGPLLQHVLETWKVEFLYCTVWNYENLTFDLSKVIFSSLLLDFLNEIFGGHFGRFSGNIGLNAFFQKQRADLLPHFPPLGVILGKQRIRRVIPEQVLLKTATNKKP